MSKSLTMLLGEEIAYVVGRWPFLLIAMQSDGFLRLVWETQEAY